MQTPKSTNGVRRVLIALGAQHHPSLAAVKLVAILMGSDGQSKLWEIQLRESDIRLAVEAANKVPRQNSLSVFAAALKSTRIEV